MPKNITLAIDEDLLDKARVLAAMRRTSVNEMVREYLEAEVGMAGTDAHKTDWQAFFDRVDAQATAERRAAPEGLPSRDELYEEVLRERGLL